MTRTITIGLVALAFVAGSIMTGSMAYAVPNGEPFQALWNAIEELRGGTEDINIGIGELRETDESLQSQIDSLDSSSDLPVFIKHVTLLDDDNGHSHGWNPNGFTNGVFSITDSELRYDSIITVYMEFPRGLQSHSEYSTSLMNACTGVTFTNSLEGLPQINVGCGSMIVPDGSILHYTMINPVTPEINYDQLTCDYTLDGVIDATELGSFLNDRQSFPANTQYGQDAINSIENNPASNHNGVIDTQEELGILNSLLGPNRPMCYLP